MVLAASMPHSLLAPHTEVIVARRDERKALEEPVSGTATVSKSLSDLQVDRVCQRALKFLGTLSRNGQIRRILDQGGYTAEEHQQGWALALEVLGYSTGAAHAEDTSPASAAIAELDQWDGPNFARARAALEHKFPEQAAYVFSGIAAKSGAESVAAVQTFLDRIDVLRGGTDGARKASKAADKSAVDLLAKRRIVDAKTGAHLRSLIASATTLAPAGKDIAQVPEDRQVLVLRLEAWLNDWRETARVLVTRRDYRIALGLAQRRVGGRDEVVEEETDGGGESGGTPVVEPGTAEPDAEISVAG
jgi:hypothetical protein